MHMYFSIDVFPMPAGAWTVIIVGKDGPLLGTDQHFPNISSMRTDWTGEMSPAPLTGRVKYWTILARSSISNFAALFVLICDMTEMDND